MRSGQLFCFQFKINFTMIYFSRDAVVVRTEPKVLGQEVKLTP